MFGYVKDLLRKGLGMVAGAMVGPFVEPINSKFREIHARLDQLTSPQQLSEGFKSDTAMCEIMLRNQYRLMAHSGVPLPRIEEVGYAIASESDEDGILNFIFALIGETSKELVDIGAVAVDGSNTANLIINHGWTGLLIEASQQKAEHAQSFYARCRSTKNFPPKIVNAWITAENVNQLLADNGIAGEIDLLCIDIDGIDYWLWKAITAINPRVLVTDYQCIWGPEASVTVPYDPQFRATFIGPYGVYGGASLAALVKLGKKKGYRLVGAQRYGYNAFFVRNDLGKDVLPERKPGDCFSHPFTSWTRETLLAQVSDRDWVEV